MALIDLVNTDTLRRRLPKDLLSNISDTALQEALDMATDIIEDYTQTIFSGASNYAKTAEAAAYSLATVIVLSVAIGEPFNTASFTPDSDLKINLSAVKTAVKTAIETNFSIFQIAMNLLGDVTYIPTSTLDILG